MYKERERTENTLEPANALGVWYILKAIYILLSKWNNEGLTFHLNATDAKKNCYY